MTRLGQMLYEDGRVDGRSEGRIEGRIEGGMQMLIILVKKGILKLKDAAEQVNMSETDFEERMKENQS